MISAPVRSRLPAGQTFAALAYRDLRAWRNRLRVLLATRWRALGYLPALAFSGFGIAGRLLHRSGSTALLPVPHDWVGVASTFIPALGLFTLGTGIVVAVRRGAMLFQVHSPDPYLLGGSAMPPRLVVLWLLVTRSRLVRLAITALLVLLFLPSTFGVSGGIGAAWVTSTRLLGLLPAVVGLPAFALSRRLPGVPIRYAGYALIGLGMLTATASGLVALGTGGEAVRVAQTWLLALPPASFVYAAVTGAWWGLAALAALIAGFALVTWWLAADCYPELFMADQAHLQLAARRSGSTAADLRSGLVASHEGRVPAREWVLLWRWWVLERRMSPRSRVLVYGGTILTGGLAGWLLQVGPGWFSTAGLILFAMIASSNNFSSGTTGNMFEFRTPMWHLVAAPLRNRLQVLALSNSLGVWSYAALLLLATGLARPALLPALIAGALSLAGYLWVRQSFDMMFAIMLPDPTSISARNALFPIVMVVSLMVGMVVFISLASTFGPAALLLPLILLVPAGFVITAITARMLGGNEVMINLAAGR